MLSKRFKRIFFKDFKEENLKYLPYTKVYGMPNDYVARILLLLLVYGFYLGIGISIFLFLAFVYLKNGDEFSFFMSSSLVISVFAIVLTINDLVTEYSKSKDINILRTMPIKDSEIYLSKFLALVLSKFEVFFFYILMGIVYFFNVKFRLIRLFGYILNFVPIIIIPVAIISLIIMLIMRFSNIRAYTNIFKYVGYGFGLLLTGLIYFYAFGPNNDDGEAFSKIGKIFLSYDSSLSFLFIHTRIYAKSLSGNLPIFFEFSLLLYLYCILLLIVTGKIASKIYLDSFMDNGYSRKNKRNKIKSNARNSKIMAIAKKDFKLLISTPVFIYPLISSMIMLTIFWGFGVRGFLDMIKELDFSNKNLYMIFIIGGFVFRYFLSANDVAINASLSREGLGLYQILTYPISPKENVLGRVISISLLNLILNIALCIVISFITKVDIIASICLFVGFNLASLLSSFQGILMDSKSVNIHWEKEKELTKGLSVNIGYYLASGIGLVIIGVFTFLIYKVTNMYVAFLFVMFLIIIAIFLFYKACIKSYAKGFYDL